MSTARRKGRGYEIRVSVGSDYTGKRIRKSMIYIPKDGMTPSQIEKELQRQKVMYEEEIKGGRCMNGKIKLHEFIEIWKRDYAEQKLAKKTYYRYLEYLKRINEALGHLKLQDIKPIHLNRFYQMLAEDGINKKAVRDDSGKIISNGRLAPKTILEHHRIVSTMLNCAVKWRFIPENVATLSDPPKVPHQERECLTDSEARQLIMLLGKEPIHYRTMIIVLIYTGLRRGELLGLEWGDIDFENKTITISRSLQYLGGGVYHVKEPKTKSGFRKLSISSYLCDLLLEYKDWKDDLVSKVGDSWIESDRLFTRPTGDFFLPDTITWWFRKFIYSTDLPKVSLHSLRHTNATLLIAEGTDVVTVSKRLGHANTSITLDTYAHALKSKDQQAANTLDDILRIEVEKVDKNANSNVIRGKFGGNVI